MSGRPDPLDPVEVVDLIAEAARACPAVAGLHGGLFGQCTTYLPGRRVPGVTLSGDQAVVGVVGCYPASVAEIASQVRAAVGALVPGVPVTVNVEDILLPGERPAGESRDSADDPAGGGAGRGGGAAPASRDAPRRIRSRTSTVGHALASPEKE